MPSLRKFQHNLKAVTEEEIFCSQGLDSCLAPGEFSFPGNEEAMDLACEKGISYYNCMKRVHGTCPDGDRTRLKEFDLILHKLHALCDEDNELHKALAQDIGCIKDSLLNFNVSCDKLAVKIRDLAGFKTVVENEEYIKFGCLRRMAEVSCILTKIGQFCGSSTEEAFLNAVKVLEEKDEFCPGSAFQEALELIQNLEIEEEVKNRFQTLREEVVNPVVDASP